MDLATEEHDSRVVVVFFPLDSRAPVVDNLLSNLLERRSRSEIAEPRNVSKLLVKSRVVVVDLLLAFPDGCFVNAIGAGCIIVILVG
jgi:hypothetical protein